MTAQTDCINYTGYTNKSGYGVKRVAGKHCYVHRLIVNAQPGDVVMHSCDNPSCINPAHLKIGTHQDNQADKVLKNRQAKGEANGRAKLTKEQVEEIRQSKEKGVDLAARFGVTSSTITKIRKNNRWSLNGTQSFSYIAW